MEKTKRACFGYSLGRCKGACLGEELPVSYNTRFVTAFFNNTIKPWPFSAPILILESDSDTEIAQGYLFDKWCYLGSIRSSFEAGFFQESLIGDIVKNDLIFDFDVYKILKNYLQLKRRGNIKVLNQQVARNYFPQQ